MWHGKEKGVVNARITIQGSNNIWKNRWVGSCYTTPSFNNYTKWLAYLSFNNTIFDDVCNFIGIKSNLYVFESIDGVVVAEALSLVMLCPNHNVCKLINYMWKCKKLDFSIFNEIWEWYFVQCWPKYVNEFYGKN